MAVEVKGHTVPHLKALGHGKYDQSGLSYGNTLSINQDVLKNANLQHKKGFVDSQGVTCALYKTGIIFLYKIDFETFSLN